MKKRFNKLNYLLIALVFAAISALGIFGAYALSERTYLSAFWSGSGTKDDPYRIFTASQLYNLQEISSGPLASERTKDKFFVIENDITLFGSPTQSTFGFEGTLDGGGHTVTLRDNGLMYRVSKGGVIQNVNLKIDFRVNDKLKKVYGIAYELKSGGIIRDCSVSGNIVADNVLDTAVVQLGYYYCSPVAIRNSGTIENCSFSGNIEFGENYYVNDRQYVGGIAACGKGTVRDCSVSGDMIFHACSVRGFYAGIAYEANVVNSTFNGNIRVFGGEKTYQKTALKFMSVYGIGKTASGCGYYGDIIFSENAKPGIPPLISDENSTFVFDGLIYKLLSDGTKSEL